MEEKAEKISFTSNSDFLYMSFHAREEAKNWNKISKLALDFNMVIQASVLSIYASELYLKSLLMLLGVDALSECKGNNGHKLLLLFRKIPDMKLKSSIANNVIYRCNDLQKKFKDEEQMVSYFEKQIEKISTAYEQYRYLYEKFLRKTPISIPLDLVFNLCYILGKECDLIEYEKVDENGNITDTPDVKYRYYIVGKGWVDELENTGKNNN